MRPASVFLVALVSVVSVPVSGLDGVFLGPGPVATRGAWSLSVRADRYTGPTGPSQTDFGEPGPVTSSLLDFPVVVLEGPGKKRWEYSTLYDGSRASAVSWLRLEPDWDGDGRPEVAGRFHPGYQLGVGIRPSGIVSITDRLLLTGASGWKGTVVIGRVQGDETGGEIQGVSVALVPGKVPRPVRWAWSENEGEVPDVRTVVFSVTKLDWNAGVPVDGDRVEARATVTSDPRTGDEVVDPGWPRVTLADDRVNLREGTDQSFPSLGLLSRGTVLLVHGMDSQPGVSGSLRSPWLRVEPASGPLQGKVGWVFAHYCAPAF